MKKLLIFGFVIVLAVALLVLVSQKAKPTTSTPSLTPVTLALDWTPNTNHTGIYVAVAKGWYKKEGIDLKILPFSSAASSDILVATKKADVGISSTEGVVADRGAGSPVVSLAAIIGHNTSALAVRSDVGVTRPRDLDGKTYGGFGAPFEVAVIKEIIKKDGGKGEFQNVILDVDAMQALESKRIDFVWSFEGWDILNAQKKGMLLTVFPISKHGIPDYATPNIIAHPDAVKERAGKIARFMRATKKGFEFARTNPKEAAQLLISQNPKGTFPDEEFILTSQEYLSPRYADKGVAWGLQSAQMWQEYPEFMLKNGAVKDAQGKEVTSLDYESLYTNEFIK